MVITGISGVFGQGNVPKGRQGMVLAQATSSRWWLSGDRTPGMTGRTGQDSLGAGPFCPPMPGLLWGAAGDDLGPGVLPGQTQESWTGLVKAGSCFQQSFIQLFTTVHVLTESLRF